MKILFVHQNFPAQYKHLASHLARSGHEVAVLTPESNKNDLPHDKITKLTYRIDRGNAAGIHPWIIDLETKIIRAEACARAAEGIRDNGYSPDVIINHPGWGESLLLKDIWHDAKLLSHGEFYYRPKGLDVGFDQEFDSEEPFDRFKLELKNINADIYLSQADAVVASTEWQAMSFPESSQDKIHIIHEGIDTNHLSPNPKKHLTVNYKEREPVRISSSDGVVTFVSRDLEPMRGFHKFMRALPLLLRKNSRCKVLILGADGPGYGIPIGKLAKGYKNWKEYMLAELKDELPENLKNRIHFLGRVPYHSFIDILNLSTVHVYLTYPFVLSWSLLEAMSLGKVVVASDTPPVKEVIKDGKNGVLVDFFDHEKLAEKISEVLANPEAYRQISEGARQTIIDRYDLESVALPKYEALLRKL